MTLADYLATQNLSDAAFGLLCKPSIHRTRIHAYRTERSRPNAEKIAAIEVATNRLVTAQDWTPKRRRRNRRAA
jgi:hypothetical protein